MELSFSANKAQVALGQQVSLAVTKKTLDTTEHKGTQMVEMLKASHPNLGKNIDLKG